MQYQQPQYQQPQYQQPVVRDNSWADNVNWNGVGVTIGYIQKQIRGVKSEEVYNLLQEKDKKSNGMQIGLRFESGKSWRAGNMSWGIAANYGLLYEFAGSSNTESESGTYGKETAKESVFDHELIIPLRLQFRFTPFKDVSVFLYTGPSFDIGLACTDKYDYEYKSKSSSSDNEKYTDKVDYYSGKATTTQKGYSYDNDAETKRSRRYLWRFHPMWGFGGGIQWKGLRLDLYADWGIGNIVYNGNGSYIKENDIDLSEYDTRLNRPFAIQLTYMF